MRRIVRFAAALAAVVGLGGCASLPTSGAIHTVTPEVPEEYSVDVLAQGPQEGQTAREVVEGFLSAAAYGVPDEFSVARTYLSDRAAEAWLPLQTVYVYSAADEPVYSVRDDGGIDVTVQTVATVDEDGRYTVESQNHTAQFSLVRGSDGQWRISTLSDELLISDLAFEQTFAQSQLQFVSADATTLVPDVRWYPQSDRAQRLVEGLLEGPSGWLAPGVITAFPEGTTLGKGGVTVDGNVVRVDLSATAGEATDEELPYMLAQLHATLASLTDVTIVEVSIDGEQLTGVDPAQDFTLPQSVSAPLMLQDNVLVKWTGSELQVVDDSAAFQDSEPRYPTVPYAESSAPVVVVSGGDTLRTVAGTDTPAQVLYEAPDLAVPSYDKYDWVWTSPGENTGQLVVASVTAGVGTVSSTWLDGRAVDAVAVSPGGDQVAVVSHQGSSYHLDVAVIVRDRAGTPVSLGEPIEPATSLTGVADVAWVDSATLAVLGSELADPSNRLYIVPIGGPIKSRPQLDGVVSLTSNRSERSILAATDDGRLFQRTGSGWREVSDTVRDPAYSG